MLRMVVLMVFFGQSFREHWGIENRPHWVLDVSSGEDGNRTRSGEFRQAASPGDWFRPVGELVWSFSAPVGR